MILGHLFKEEIQGFQYYHILFPTLFGLAVISVVYRKFKVFKERKFARSKFDVPGQIVTILIGISVTTVVVYYWIPYSYLHWTFLIAGVAGTISGLFYENTIQLYYQDGWLNIEYASKGKYKINTIDSFEVQNGVLSIKSGERRIEVYNVSMSESNTSKLTQYLADFQHGMKKKANIIG